MKSRKEDLKNRVCVKPATAIRMKRRMTPA